MCRHASPARAAVIGLLLAALFAMTGAQWVALQSVAWIRMMAEYSRDGSLLEAVCKTFDGAHPCPLCKRIATEKQAPNSIGAAMELEKVTLLCEETPEFPQPVQPCWSVEQTAIVCRYMAWSPPVPPPRTGV
jgi:hypothetical protein